MKIVNKVTRKMTSRSDSIIRSRQGETRGDCDRDRRAGAMTQIASAILVLLLAPLSAVSSPALSDPAASPPPTVNKAELFRQIKVTCEMAREEIGNLPDAIHAETLAVMKEVDHDIKTQLAGVLETHYGRVERILQDVHLPVDDGNLGVWWKQTKALLSRGDLDQIVEDYVIAAQKALQPAFGDLQGALQETVEAALIDPVSDAQKRIKGRFDEVISSRFPVWEDVDLPLPPPPNANPIEDGAGGHLPIAAVGGLLILLMRKTIQRLMKRLVRKVVRKIAGKIVAKMAGKLVPFLGLLLILLEAYDVGTAKAQLEKELRERFVTEYRASVTVEVLWQESMDDEPSLRSQVKAGVGDHLQHWAAHCRKQALEVIEVGPMLETSPQLDEWLAQQEEKGRATDEVLSDIRTAWNVFGPLVAEVEISRLLEMLAHDASQETVQKLAAALGPRLLESYEETGPRLFRMAERIGPDRVAQYILDGREADLKAVWKRLGDYPTDLSEDGSKVWRLPMGFEFPLGGYPTDLSEDAIEGLFLATRFGFPLDDPIRTDLLELFAVHQDVVLAAGPILAKDRKKLITLFKTDRVIRKVAEALELDQELALAMLENWQLQVWDRFASSHEYVARAASSDEQVTTVLAAGRYLLEKGWTASETAHEVEENTRLVGAYKEYGKRGLNLFDAYVRPGDGSRQRDMADRAMALFGRGYDLDALLDPANLPLAQFVDAAPGFGPRAFGLLHQLRFAAYLIVIVIYLLLAWFFLWVFKRVRRTFARAQ